MKKYIYKEKLEAKSTDFGPPTSLGASGPPTNLW